MATNAARYRMVAGKHVNLLEFGLRRAQGPDGGLSASKYSYIGKYFSVFYMFSFLEFIVIRLFVFGIYSCLVSHLRLILLRFYIGVRSSSCV